MATILELAQAHIRGEIPPVAFQKFLGISIVEVEPGRAVIEFEAGEQYTRLSDHPAPEGRNPFINQVIGGALGAVADLAMGTACASLLGEGEGLTTLEMKLSFLRPVKPGKLTAQGRATYQGRTVGFGACDITDAEGRLVATGTCTCLVLRAEDR